MRNNFKPLGIAAAVAAAAAGYANVASAQTTATPAVANNALGDLAIVPYYTVQEGWVTGVHVINTSSETQVVKFRLRRASDSLDALDFNIIMSPEDVWAGFISQDESGDISFSSNDTTCTAPAAVNGAFVMPDIYREGAETGYVEVIAMGASDGSGPIDDAAVHVDDIPVNCEAVRSNFFASGTSATAPGVFDYNTSYQASYKRGDTTVEGGENAYEPAGDVLKVSYFIRDNDSGVEFGDNAVHISGFLAEASITNQERGYLSGDLQGFDFPDLNGGVPNSAADDRGQFALLRSPGVLGVGELINEWSANPSNGVAVDWVVTMPGQYTMLDMPNYIAALDDEDLECNPGTAGTAYDEDTGANCDFRDIPVTATVVPYNREEFTPDGPSGELVVSPSLPGAPDDTVLEKEVNVISFGGNSVLGDTDVDITADLRQPYGWVNLSVTSRDSGDQAVCEWQEATAPETIADLSTVCSVVLGNVPMIGFAAWQRSVAANPDASYGRIIAHSFRSAAN